MSCLLKPKLIATHKRPDVDALVSVWLAERYLFARQAVVVSFHDRAVDIKTLLGIDCVVDFGGVYCRKRLIFDHKPPAFADRHANCAATLLWRYLIDREHDVAQLEDFVRLVHDGDSAKRRAGSPAFKQSRKNGLHAAVSKWKSAKMSDADLYRRTKAWLNRQFATG